MSIAFVLLKVAFKEDNLSQWVAQARTKEYLLQGAALIDRLNPEDWFERGRKAIEDGTKKTPFFGLRQGHLRSASYSLPSAVNPPRQKVGFIGHYVFIPGFVDEFDQ